MNQQGHVPVLLEEVLEYAASGREGIYIDGTIGLAGHSLEILKRNPRAKVIGFDIDELALAEAKLRLKPYAGRAELYHADFRRLPELDIDFAAVRALLLDLGLSSFQLDRAERGFSYNLDGPLDMRMDLRNRTTAEKIIASYSEPRLARLFWDYGELKQARRLAKEIVSRRKTRKIATTLEFRRIIEEVCRWSPQKGKIHPAAKVFQALRIEINRELEGLGEFLDRVIRLFSPGARLVVISFHSLEDRIIKHALAKLAASQPGPPLVRILTKKPITPSEEEIAANSRAHSAKLRAGERI